MTIIATQRKTIKVGRYIFDSSLCYIHAGNKSLKILDAIIRHAVTLRKRYSLTTLKFLFTVVNPFYLNF